MKNRLLIIIIFCSVCPQVFAKSHVEIDSLKQVLAISKQDSNMVNTLNELSRQYLLVSEFDTAKMYAEHAFHLSGIIPVGKKTGWTRGEAIALNLIGSICKEQGDYEEGLESCNKAIEIAEKSECQDCIASSYSIIGNIHQRQGNYDESLKYHLASLKIREEMRDKRNIAGCYLNIGVIYERQGKFSEALKNNMIALKMKQEIGDSQAVGKLYVNIGLIYSQQGNPIEALKNFLNALDIFEALGDKLNIAKAYTNIGVIHFDQHNYSESMKYSLASLKIRQEIGDKKGIAREYKNIGLSYEMQGNHDEALKNYLAALELREQIGDKEGVAAIYDDIGVIYSKKGNYSDAIDYCLKGLRLNQDIGRKAGIVRSSVNAGTIYSKRGEFNKAFDHLNSGLAMAREMNLKEGIRDAYSAMSLAYAEKNDYRNAYKYYQLFTGINDSLLNDDNNRVIAQMKEQYESDKKDKEIALLNKDKEIQLSLLSRQRILKNGLIVVSILILIAGSLQVNRIRLMQRQKTLAEHKRISSELHDDIGATLSGFSIYSDVIKQDVSKGNYSEAVSAIESIGNESRELIDRLGDIVWAINPRNDSFDKLIARLEAYAQRVCSGKNIALQFETDEILRKMELPMEVRNNYYLIAKEAVNNAAKYSGCQELKIHLHLKGKTIVATITDDGKGFDATQVREGNGLRNMKQRADDIKAYFEVASSPGKGTQMTMSVSA